jgi:hypothetical protein
LVGKSKKQPTKATNALGGFPHGLLRHSRVSKSGRELSEWLLYNDPIAQSQLNYRV